MAITITPVTPAVVEEMKKNSEKGQNFVKHITHLKAGDPAPLFEGTDQQGRTIGLASFPGKAIILYFYPKDDTQACTATACSLRDEYRHFADRHYAVIGVSADNQRSHARFAKKHQLPFPLIADTSMAIIRAYDVWGSKMLFGRIYDGIVRTTFVIGADGVIKEVISKVDSANHATQILEIGGPVKLNFKNGKQQ